MRLVRPDADDEEVQLLTRRLIPGLVAYLVVIIAGVFAPIVASVGYLAGRPLLHYPVPSHLPAVPRPLTAVVAPDRL